jgi:hypothetical protein
MWALQSLLLSCAVQALPNVQHGLSPARPLAWLDVPVFWINLDSAIHRAEMMRAQLSHALLPGLVATRVPALRIDEVATAVKGDLLFRANTSELLFCGPSTHHLEIAVMASHVKAILWGSRLGTAHDAFLVLEDDVELLFFPRVRLLRPEWPTAGLTADGLRRSLPGDWSFAQLFATTFPTRWQAVRDAWKEGGRATAIHAEKVTFGEERGCPSRLQSAGAYFVRSNAAAEVLATWPAHETAIGSERKFRLNASHTCFEFRSVTGQRCNMEDKWQHTLDLFPRFISDTCLLHMESYGPVLSTQEAPVINAALRSRELSTSQFRAARAGDAAHIPDNATTRRTPRVQHAPGIRAPGGLCVPPALQYCDHGMVGDGPD